MSSRKQRDVEKQQFWRLVFEEHAQSGLSVRAFCRQESLSEPSFYSWRRTIRDGELPSPAQKHGFAAVRVAGAPPAAASSGHRGIEIVTPDNILVRLGGDCSTETIHRVLTALQQQAAPC
jgi:transposase-like protein